MSLKKVLREVVAYYVKNPAELSGQYANSVQFKALRSALKAKVHFKVLDIKSRHDVDWLLLWLVKTAIQNNVDIALRDLERYLRNRWLYGYYVMPLPRVHLEPSSYTFTNGVTISNSSDAPFGEFLNVAPYPQSLLYLPAKFRKPFLKYTSIETKNATNRVADAKMRFVDTVNCLNLVRPIAFGIQTGPAVIELVSDNAPIYGRTSYPIEGRSSKWGMPIIGLECRNANTHLINLERFKYPQEMRNQLKRLSEYMTAGDLVNSAIELRILLDMVFLDENEKGEVAFRVSVRAARLLGKDMAERIDIYKEFKKIYNLCSGAVHTGVVSTKMKKAYPLYNEVAARVRSAISRSLDNGLSHNWEQIVFHD